MKNFIIKSIYKYSRGLILLSTFSIAFLALGIPKIQMDYNQKSWFREGDTLLANYENFKNEYGSDQNIIFVLDFNDDVFKLKNMQKVNSFTNDLWSIPNFLRIDNIINFSQVSSLDGDINIAPFLIDPDEKKWTQEYLDQKREQAQDISEFKNFLIAKNNKSVAIYGAIKNLEGSEGKITKEIIKEVRKSILPKYHDIKIHITGSGGMGDAFEQETINDFKLIIPLAFIVLAIILLAFLKNILATVISLGLVTLTLLATLGLQGWLGVKMGLITAMCPLIVIAICIVDLVHIFSGHLNGHKENVLDPLKYTLEKNLIPTLLTTSTTMIGFVSFATSKLIPLASLGLIAALGIALAWIYTVFLICPLLNIIHISPNKFTKFEINTKHFKKIAELVEDSPFKIVFFFSTIISLSFYLASQNVIDSNMKNYFSESTAFKQANNFFHKNIGSTNNVEIVLKSGKNDGIKDPHFLNKADKFISELRSLSYVTKANSIIDKLKKVNEVIEENPKAYGIADSKTKVAQELFFIEMSLPATKSMTQFMSIDKANLRVSVFWDKESSVEIAQGQKQIEKLLQKHNLNGYLTGMAPLVSGLDKYLINAFIESMIISTISISIFMMIVFKSFFYGLLCIIPNIIVPSIGAGALYLAGKTFDTGSVLLFSICLGIAIDDTIYFITNLKRELKKQHTIEQSIQNVITKAGKTLSVTSFILISMFALFWLGSFVPNQNFAFATTIILGSALVLDIIFLPAMILSLKRLKSSKPKLLKLIAQIF